MSAVSKAARGACVIALLVLAAGVGLSADARAQDTWWARNHYRNGYPTTEECFRLINGMYGGVWFTQNIAYVDYGGDCNAQHTLGACWLTAASWGRNGGTITSIGSEACNASGTSIAQGNVTVLAGDTGLVSVLQYWDSNTGAYYGPATSYGP
jgi:hypothetical protein